MTVSGEEPEPEPEHPMREAPAAGPRATPHGAARESRSCTRRRPGSTGFHTAPQLTSGSYAQRVRDELLSQGKFYGMSKRDSIRRADELIESLDLGSFAGRAV